MKKKIILYIVLKLAVICSIWAFDYSSYNVVSLDYIDNLINENRINTDGTGVTLYDNKYMIELEINNNYPVIPVTEMLKMFIQLYSNFYGFSETHGIDFLVNIYTHMYLHVYNDNNYILYFQHPLADPFNEKVNIGDKIRFYVLFGICENYTKNVFLFVNAWVN